MSDETREKLPLLKEVAKEMFEAVMDTFHKDNHYFNTRPCSTCDSASKIMGFDIGCTRFRKTGKRRE